MGEPSPKKSKPSAKSLANLRPNPQSLKRGGKKPQEFITQPELDFCNYLLDGATGKDAVIWAGFPTKTPSQLAYNLRHKPIVARTLEELQEQRKKESIERTSQLREERRIFAHHHSLHLARKMKTHKYRGDADIVKHAENLLRSVGDIQPNTVSAKAGAVAGALAAAPTATSIPHLFVPAWKKAMTQVVEGEPSVPQLGSSEPGAGRIP